MSSAPNPTEVRAAREAAGLSQTATATVDSRGYRGLMTITIEQFNAIKKLSRMGSGARAQCAKLVLVDGLTPTEAARQVGTTPQTAHAAVKAATATLSEARIAAGL